MADAISNLKNTPTDPGTVEVRGYFKPGDGGGGSFYWDGDENKQNHNGGTVIDPDHPVTPNANDAAWYAPSENIETGCWKKVNTRFLMPEFFGVMGGADKDSAKDETAGILKCFRYASDHKLTIKNFEKVYICNKIIGYDLAPDDPISYLNLEATGKIIREKDKSADVPVIKVSGATGTSATVDADIEIGTNIIKSDLAPTLKSGDLILITSDKDFENNSVPENRRKQGEIGRVRRVVDNEIYTSDTRMDTYLTEYKAKIVKINPGAFNVFGNLTIDHNPSDPTKYTRGIEIAYCLEPVTTLSFENITRHAFVCYSCYKPVITVRSDNNAVVNPGKKDTGEGQSIIISSATMYGRFYGSGFYTRHTVAAGAAPAYPGVSWENRVINFVGNGGGISAVFDAHAQVGSIYYENCVAIGGTISDPDAANATPYGFQLGGRRNYIKNCKAIGCKYGAITRNISANIEVYDIDGFAVERGDVIFAFAGATEQGDSNKAGQLYFNNIKAELGYGDVNTGFVFLEGEIKHWSFNNINIKNGNIIDFTSVIRTPAHLILNNFKCVWKNPASLDNDGKLIEIKNQNITHIRLNNIHTKNGSRLLQLTSDSNADLYELDLLELINVDVSGSENHHILIASNTNVSTLVLKGGSYGSSRSNSSALIALNGAIQKATVAPSKTEGENLKYLFTGSGMISQYQLGGDASNIEVLFNNIGGDLLEVASGSFNHPRILSGSGDPNGSLPADEGVAYLRKDGDSGTTLYVKETGGDGTFGWEAK